MREPAQTLIGEVERVVSALPDAVLFPGLGADGPHRFAVAMGVPAPPGLAAFLAAHDGGMLAPDAKLLTLDEATARVSGPGALARAASAARAGRPGCGRSSIAAAAATRWTPKRRTATANGRWSR